MNKQAFFGILFCSWILGVSLICLFPPIPDYKVTDQNSGFLSQDSTPELYLRNSSRASISQLDFGIELIGWVSDFRFITDPQLVFSFELSKAPYQIASFFDAKILFRAFFETW